MTSFATWQLSHVCASNPKPGKMETTSAKVELFKNSKVKLPMAELDYLKRLGFHGLSYGLS